MSKVEGNSDKRQKKNQLKQNKKCTKNHEVHFALAMYNWAWGLLWCVVDTPRNTPLEEADFALSQQVSIVNRVSVRSGTLYPLSLLRARTLSGLHLCRSLVAYHSFWELKSLCQSCCVWKNCFLGVIHHLWLFQTSCLLFR